MSEESESPTPLFRWHPIKTTSTVDNDQMKDLRNSGVLLSITREPPQNTSDNPLPEIEESWTSIQKVDRKPIQMRYKKRFVKVADTKIFLDENWLSHMTAPKNIGGPKRIYEKSNFDVLNAEQLTVLLIEDYGTTGLVGDVAQYKEEFEDDLDYTKECEENTFFWFARAESVSREKTKRGGSWGKGKFALPLASKVRTHFCVTVRYEDIDGKKIPRRYLYGSSHINRHHLDNQGYEPTMCLGKYNVSDPKVSRSWVPIDDPDVIDQFCKSFGVTRSLKDLGTSFVVIEPQDCVTFEALECGVLTNWSAMIHENRLSIEVSDHTLDKKTSDSSRLVNYKTLRARLNSRVWVRLNQQRVVKGTERDLIISQKEALIQHLDMYNALMNHDSLPDVTLELKGERPYDLLSQLLGSFKKDGKLSILRDKLAAATATMPLKVFVRCPIEYTKADGRGKTSGGFTVVMCKYAKSTRDPVINFKNKGRSFYYRDFISLRELDFNNGKEGLAFIVKTEFTEEGNAFRDLIRSAEGPAHLKCFHNGVSVTNQYQSVRDVIKLFIQAPILISDATEEVEHKREPLWGDIFSFGITKSGSPQLFDIDSNKNGVLEIKAKKGKLTTGQKYLLRLSYDDLYSVVLKDGDVPDDRILDIEKLIVDKKYFATIQYVPVISTLKPSIKKKYPRKNYPDRLIFTVGDAPNSLRIVLKGLQPLLGVTVQIDQWKGGV